MENQKRARGRPKSQFKESSAGMLQSLDRALGTLSTVAKLEACTLSDLSRETGVPTATTHRILTTLSNRGYVSFDEDRQEWMIGIEAYRTGASYLKRNSVVEIGRPIMRKLMQDTGETANMATPNKCDVVFVSQVETINPIRAFFPAGSRTPMYASGTGKALLAAMQPKALRKSCLQQRLNPSLNALMQTRALCCRILRQFVNADGLLMKKKDTTACLASVPQSTTSKTNLARVFRCPDPRQGFAGRRPSVLENWSPPPRARSL